MARSAQDQRIGDLAAVPRLAELGIEGALHDPHDRVDRITRHQTQEDRNDDQDENEHPEKVKQALQEK